MPPSSPSLGRRLVVLTGTLSVALSLALSAAAAGPLSAGTDVPLTSGADGTVPAAAPAAAGTVPVPVPTPLLPPSLAAAPVAVDLPNETVARLLATQSAAGLTCSTSLLGTPLCVHGEDAPPPEHAAAAAGTDGAGGSSGGQLGCYGDGTSGPRVRAVYARAAGSIDRYAAALPDFQRWAAAASGQFDASATATGGRRHIRFATSGGPSCSLAVTRVELPASAFDSFRATIDALQDKGLSAPHSKYLVWADAGVMCGMATTFADDRPGADNLNNSSITGYARVDRSCWGKVEAHEIVHLLGGVQPSSPHSTAGFHCHDGRDVMCYADGTARSMQTAVCPAERARLLDCRNDDYFSTAPARGSYLDTHWNTARSSFLAAELTQAAAPAPQPSRSSAPPPSPSASPRSAGSPLSVVPALLAVVPVPSSTRPASSAPATAVAPAPVELLDAVPALVGLGR